MAGSSTARMSKRKLVIIWVIVLVIVFVASLGIAVSHIQYYGPDTVTQSIALLFELGWQHIADPSALLDQQERMWALDGFFEVRTRLLISILTVACGALLALSGSLYQAMFRNPIAAPTMLGVSNGVNLGVLVLILQFESAAIFMNAQRYLYCYIGALAVLALVMGLTVALGRKRRFSVVTLLLVASIVSQLLGTVITYITATQFDDATLIAYQEILQVLDVQVEPLSFALLGATVLVGALPLFFFRFSMNALSLSDEEAQTLGTNQTLLRIVALACGTVMIISCEVLVGTVSMVSLFVPFISRALFGAEFRGQLLGNMLIGSTVLLLCRSIADMIPFVGQGFPIGVVVSFVALPFFVAAIVAQQRTWE